MRAFHLLSVSCLWIFAPAAFGENINPLIPGQRNSSDCGGTRPCPNPDANLVDPDTVTDEPPAPPTKDQIDKDTIQCTYYQDYQTECQTQCSEDPVVWEIDPSKNMKIMHRECYSKKVWHFKWEESDGVIDSTVFPKAKFRPDNEVVAICTFSKTKKYFDCAGVAVCDPKRSGIDQCSGGLPWRGLKWSGDPLKEKSPKGNITSYAQNAPSSDTEEPEPDTTTTTRKSRRTPRHPLPTTTESDTGNADSQTDKPSIIYVIFVSPVQSFFSRLFQPVRSWFSRGIFDSFYDR
ncbi:uncharacterized protein LOC129582025 [Paramacrobiotus metropolitanus]|uniref:uncharacterized protein LOC129582025 n=1 Tax=Paramacrobiotus metropolitanus TaxID=2943436 RepID=UPI00244652E9|nr:uncharacterized protein LOC129582025 [Paramacrobiotus metropolitanus]